jgi:hypothetical protein
MQELVRTHQQQLQQLGFARQQIVQRQALYTGNTHSKTPEDRDPEVFKCCNTLFKLLTVL